MIEVPAPYRQLMNRASSPFPSSQNELCQQLQVLCSATFCVSLSRNDTQKVARDFVERLTDAVYGTAKWLKSS